MRSPLGRALLAVLTACMLVLGTAGCNEDKTSDAVEQSKDPVKFAKTKFVLHSGLAAGASYRWIVKPYREGKFQSGADGRTFALVKAGLAGAFTYHEVKKALDAAQGDPTLSKALVPITAVADKLRDLGGKLSGGNATDADVNDVGSVIDGLKSVGTQNGLTIEDKEPSLSQLNSG
ncbi:hypothetical protein [Yinghuangia seranimata]|uniref:hypothetical protein n=1 Tax=Yinghuangia seranimata TaxID=408067 RepID=UPI00248BD70B|nr:hypothetical protein [Yinghuangia seranimata]MDI2126398.1 hypothetical protein [Yinghuangia seranimata]